MRTKLLRRADGATVRLFFPDAYAEYRAVFQALGRPFRRFGGVGAPAPAPAPAPRAVTPPAYVVTTMSQRDGWLLGDFAGGTETLVVDEARAVDMLLDRASDPAAAYRSFFPGDREAAGRNGGTAYRAASEAVRTLRDLEATDAVVAGVLDNLALAGLPPAVAGPLSRSVGSVLASQGATLSGLAERVRLACGLRYRTARVQCFDRRRAGEALAASHVGLDLPKARILDFLAVCPQARDLLTVESFRAGKDIDVDPRTALVVRAAPVRDPDPVLCLAGPPGTGKASLARTVARALRRPHVSESLDPDDPAGGGSLDALLRGAEVIAPGRIVRQILESGATNPVFVLEGVDKVREAEAGALLDVLDASRRAGFRDSFLGVPFDLSPVLWITTAVDPAAILGGLRKHLEIVEMPPYSEDEKLVIARERLLRRPFEPSERPLEGPLAPPAPPGSSGPPGGGRGLAVAADRPAASMEDLPALLAESPPDAEGDQAEGWWTAAARGRVRFEPEAIRRVIRDYTSEGGVRDLVRRLARICREAARRDPATAAEPAVVTPAVADEVLGGGAGRGVPRSVTEAVAAERRRLGAGPPEDAAAAEARIDWLERLPWARRHELGVDLQTVRRALDIGHACLDDAKEAVVEHLAVRRRAPRGSRSPLCLAGPAGVGKTSFARGVARALDRACAEVACAGLRDAADVLGRGRARPAAGPGAVLRGLRRAGYRDAVFILDGIDDAGPDAAAALADALDPDGRERFRDAFVALPFDLSEVVFIATARDWSRVPAPLRDRLEAVRMPGYGEAEKAVIAAEHLIPAEIRRAGLSPAPLSFSPLAIRKIIRGYTSEAGVRQLGGRIRSICRKVVLGRETGDGALIRYRITLKEVARWLGPEADRGDGVDRLRLRLDSAPLPPAARSRCREVFEKLPLAPAGGPERARRSEYLECVAGLPWRRRTGREFDPARVRNALDATHGALDAAKESLLDELSAHARRPGPAVPAVCLAGPAATGKTTLARSVAAALGRVCAVVDCGQVPDAAAVLGAPGRSPGVIIRELRFAGAKDAVIVLDGIDRLDGARGAPSALAEALASGGRGRGFRDRYLDLPFDLSDVLFAATAVDLDRVPPALRERFAVVPLPGYTAEEKEVIIRDHLLPAAVESGGLEPEHVRATPEGLRELARGWSRGPGVGDLAEALRAFCRRVARRHAEGDPSGVLITPETAPGLLGPPASD